MVLGQQDGGQWEVVVEQGSHAGVALGHCDGDPVEAVVERSCHAVLMLGHRDGGPVKAVVEQRSHAGVGLWRSIQDGLDWWHSQLLRCQFRGLFEV